MSEAAVDSFLGEPRRLHPLTLLLAIVRLGPRSLNLIPAVAALGLTGQARYILPGIAAYIVINLIFSWLAWSRFSWTVDTDDVTISSGVVSKQQRVIPFDRIQDVSIEQGLIARLLGLAKVGFETGSSGGDKSDEARLDAIGLDEAEALRRHIRAHRGAPSAPVASMAAADGPEAVVAQDDSEGRTIFGMSVPRLIIAGIFNFSLAIFAVLFGALQYLDNVVDFDPFDVDIYRDLAQSLGLEGWVLAHRWVSVVGGILSVLLLGAVTGIVRTVIRDYGFTLDRTARGFRRRRGLTTKTDVTIPAARVQAAMLSTGFIRRRFGWYDVKLQSLGGDGKDESDHLVAPLAKLSEADTIFTELGFDRAGLEEGARADWHRSHPVAMLFVPLVILIIAALLVVVIVLIPTTILAEIDFPFDPRLIPLAPAAGALVVLFFGWLDWRHRRWHFDGRLLHIADGFLSRRHIILPARNIQSADLSVGPVARRFALADLNLGVPGGKSGQHHVSAIPEHEARTLRAALLAAR